MKNDKKWVRMWKILSFAFSVLLRWYGYRILRKSESDREKLWGRIGKEFRQTLFELEGLLIKVGQFLSIRADLLPGSFIRQIEDLVDKVPPSPWEDIKNVLEKEWDESINNRLQFINTTAVASASIGEVYRGTLKDGTEVAVKVQRPTIRSIMKTDFRSLAIIIWFAHHFAPIPKGFINFKMMFQELKTVIEKELDFTKEMESIQHFNHRFQTLNGLTIPKVYPDLCTSQVLVMEWVDGVRITDIDFLEKSQIDRGELSQRLIRAFIPQWLESGFFHADPHAGNVLVKFDGTIVLLDFGMVGEISKRDASYFQDLFQAVLMKNYSRASVILRELGFLLPEANPKTIEPILKDALSIDLNQLKKMDLLQVKKGLNDIVKLLPIQVPTRFVFLGRSFITVEGILQTINPNQELIETAKPAFKDWLNSTNQSKWRLVLKWIQSQPVFQIVYSINALLETPQRYITLKEKQQHSEFYFSIYENQKKHLFILGMVGLIGSLFSTYLQAPTLLRLSAGLIGISLIFYLVCSVKQKRWLKKISNDGESSGWWS